ncbi:hypothetical protein B0H14DRAFT_2610116 [Mycena olivaceomarginata]|nr:hypothetical protein B0H14DRAFT_2610116 [Mycena olivaceomarginata]
MDNDKNSTPTSPTGKKIKGTHAGFRKGSGHKPKTVKNQLLGTDPGPSFSMRRTPPGCPVSQRQATTSRAPLHHYFNPSNTHRPVPLADPIHAQGVVKATSPFWSGNAAPPGEMPCPWSHSMSTDNLARLNEALTYIAENDEHADIASGEAEIDESLVDAVPKGGEGDAETETQSSEAATNSVLSIFLKYVKEQLQLEIDIHKRPLCYLCGDFYWRPPHPVFSLQPEFGTNPDMVYWRDVFVWLPHLLPGAPERFKCSCNLPLSLKALMTNQLPAASIQCLQISFSSQTTFHLLAYISARGAISKLMMSQMANTFAAHFGPAPFAALVSEIQYRSHVDRELMYLAAAEFYSQSEVPPFSAFNDRNGYAGSPPSTPYLKALFTDYVSAHCIYAERDTASRTCTIGMGDHTFQLLKYMGDLKGTQIFNAAFTVLNEFEEVCTHSLTQTKSLDFVKDMFEGIRDGLKNVNHPPTQIFYTDSLQHLITPSSRLAVVALTVKTYQPANEKPCLEIIQLRTHHKIVIFKAKDLTSRSDVLPSFRAILTNPQIIKVSHSVRAGLQTIADQFLLPEISKLAKAKNPPILDLGISMISDFRCKPTQATKPGQLVTIVQACKPVAEGSLAEHPGYLHTVMDDNGTTKKINVTPSHSVVLISKCYTLTVRPNHGVDIHAWG